MEFEIIKFNNRVFAIIIRRDFSIDGIHFFTNDSDSQQLGYMNRPKDYEIKPHRHNIIQREVRLTQEVLFIKSGKVRVDFYTNEQYYLESRLLSAGDTILLSDGGHGFKMLEPSEIIEVKQGPYCGEQDKIRFEAINETKIIIK